jgi:hypothetical protein
MMECFAACVALRERRSITDRLAELGRERKSSWRDREIADLRRDLLEVEAMIGRHREAAPLRGH